MLHLRRILVSLLFPLISPIFAHSQGPIAPPASRAESVRAYENSADGLQMQLQNILAEARKHDASKLASLIKQLEIPDYEEWFAKTYGEERSERRTEAYGRTLASRESDLEMLFTQWADEEGEFTARRVNDARALGRAPGVNSPAMRGLQVPGDPFTASWTTADSSPFMRAHPLGSFVYVNGSFRLLVTIRSRPMRPVASPESSAPPPPDDTPEQPATAPDNPPAGSENNGPATQGVQIASMPSCLYCPSPPYSEAARKKRLQGTVVLQVLIQPDGLASEVQVLKSPGPELAQMAIAGVIGWRFNPARNTDGDAVPYRESVEVTFRLAR